MKVSHFIRDRKKLDINLRSAPQLREYQAIASRIKADSPKRVLDWGCGLGGMTHLLNKLGVEVQSLDYRHDIDQDGLYRMERYPQLEVYLTSEPRKLPYSDASFDAVLSCGVLEHVVDPDASLDEIWRVLKPGGTFYLYKLPNHYSYLEKIAKTVGLYYHGQDPYDRLYTETSTRKILQNHCFQVKELQLFNMLPLTLEGRVATFCAGGIWSVNKLFSLVPGVNRFATNVQAIAIKAEPCS